MPLGYMIPALDSTRLPGSDDRVVGEAWTGEY